MSVPRTALLRLKDSVTGLECQNPGPTISSRSRKLVRAASVAGQVEGKFQARKFAVLAIIDECLGFFLGKAIVLFEPLQQLVHFNRQCDGCHADQNADLDQNGEADQDEEVAAPLYGSRYECEQCKLDFCSKCYENHDHTHVLKLHRVVLPEDAATTKDLWEVKAITGHSGKGEGRLYTVKWAGPWVSGQHTKGSLKNDEVIERCVPLCFFKSFYLFSHKNIDIVGTRPTCAFGRSHASHSG
jgi:hypothetical protein